MAQCPPSKYAPDHGQSRILMMDLTFRYMIPKRKSYCLVKRFLFTKLFRKLLFLNIAKAVDLSF